jgi:uncharacterized alkaline shock family protein YloU
MLLRYNIVEKRFVKESLIGGLAVGAKIVNELGVLEITDEVLSILAGITAIECYGIVGMASKRATDGLVELLGRDNLSRGVRVHSQGDEIIIDIFIIVEYGISIAAVAKNVIDTVKYNVETITGLKVNKVNVTVEGVRV